MTEEKSLVRKSRRSSRLSTIVSITLVLFLLGTLSVLLLHANKLSDYLKENIEISLVIQPDADSLTVNELYQRVKSANYVKEVTLVSKEQAAEELKKDNSALQTAQTTVKKEVKTEKTKKAAKKKKKKARTF